MIAQETQLTVDTLFAQQQGTLQSTLHLLQYVQNALRMIAGVARVVAEVAWLSFMQVF